MPKALCIIQARMGSTRLPGKVMKQINGKSVLWHVYSRVRRSKKIDQIVIATTNLPNDDAIVEFCKTEKIECFRGEEKNVLSRYYHAAKQYHGETIVRITSDCPLIEPRIIDLMLTNYRSEWAYYSNCHPLRSVPIGLDVEISNYRFIEQAYLESKDLYEQEHVFSLFL
jgi:spore coat polysaccharide biosynthesis protein SpsF